MPPSPPQSPNQNIPPTPTLLEPPKQKKPAGPIVAIVIIVFVLALGGLYLYGAYLNNT